MYMKASMSISIFIAWKQKTFDEFLETFNF